jgi:hypothetical protein
VAFADGHLEAIPRQKSCTAQTTNPTTNYNDICLAIAQSFNPLLCGQELVPLCIRELLTLSLLANILAFQGTKQA